MKKNNVFNIAAFVAGVFLLLGVGGVVSAAVMSSSSYRIQSDSVNIGGGSASSASYNLRGTTGEQATGESTSSSYKLRAGYQQMQESFLSIDSPANVTFTALNAVGQNSAVGSVAWTVTTDNPAGYTLTVHASQAPALKDLSTGESFADYTEATPGVKETWSVALGDYEFGFSAFGSHTTGYGTDTDCIDTTDVPSATLLWEGFSGTTPIQIASSTSPTVSGTATTLCVATEQKGVFAPSGTYVATTTATVTAL